MREFELGVMSITRITISHSLDFISHSLDFSNDCRIEFLTVWIPYATVFFTVTPGLKAVHWLKSGRKSWRKMNFVINRSGVYCAPKSKSKLQSLSWICLSRLIPSLLERGILRRGHKFWPMKKMLPSFLLVNIFDLSPNLQFSLADQIITFTVR